MPPTILFCRYLFRHAHCSIQDQNCTAIHDDDGNDDDDDDDLVVEERSKSFCVNSVNFRVPELEDENLEIKSERICKICQVDEVSILFLPCGHLASCAQCAPALRTCAICRQRVKGRVRVIDEDE